MSFKVGDVLKCDAEADYNIIVLSVINTGQYTYGVIDVVEGSFFYPRAGKDKWTGDIDSNWKVIRNENSTPTEEDYNEFV